MYICFFAYYLSVIYLKKTIFIKNAVVLTVSGLILRFIGVIFKVWLASKIGSEGIGLYQVVFSVYIFLATFATSGISTAVTRICTEKIATKKTNEIKEVLKKSLIITFVVAIISACILFFGANFIANSFICDKRAVLSLKVLSFSLLFMGACSCFRGYFIAKRMATPPAISQIFEQLVRIITVIIAVKLTFSKGMAICLSGVFIGDTISEFVSALFLYAIYRLNIRNLSPQTNKTSDNIYRKIKEIALPITLGRYLNTALRTCENILAPRLLKHFASAKENALSQFGMLKGMALPLIFFPSTLLNSLSLLLIPEVTDAQTKGQKRLVSATVSNVINLTAIVSYIFSAIFFVCGKEIGLLIYKNQTVGILIKFLSPLVPLMYLDSICDGLLKGLNQQKFTFFTSVSDSAIRIVLIFFVLPKFGLLGFISIMYFSNFYTGILNIRRLIIVSEAKINTFKSVFLPCFSAILSVLLVECVVRQLCYSITSVYIILVSALSLVVYYIIISNISGFRVKEYL